MIRFAVQREHSVAPERVTALCRAASSACQIEVLPTSFSSYEDLADAVRLGETDIVWTTPIAAAMWVERGIADVMALPLRAGKLAYHTAFIQKRGGARTLEKMRNTRVAWVDPQSASGYLVPRLHLASLGIDPKSFFAEEVFMNTHRGVVDAVVNGFAGDVLPARKRQGRHRCVDPQ